MTGCKLCAMPIECNHRLKKDDSERLIDAGKYQHHVKSLVFISLTRLDITYVVSVISQFMHTPTQDHMKAGYKVLRYLKSYPRKGIFYKR